MTSVLILAFSPISNDARVLKQVRLLTPDYEVTTCGYGPAPAGVHDHVRIPDDLKNWKLDRPLVLARRFRAAQDRQEVVAWAREHLPGPGHFDVILADDAETVPLALSLHPRGGVHADLHEYAPRQKEGVPRWRYFVAPYVRWLCRTYVTRADSVTTVAQGLADEYRREFGLDPEVVTNAAPYRDGAPHQVTEQSETTPLRLVHSGAALPDRHLEITIDAIALATRPMTLDLYLTRTDPAYIARLAQRARAAGALPDGTPRVRVCDPVPYAELPEVLARYDVGVFSIPPVSFNYEHTLPNKLFDFVQARLASVVSPSPEMAALVRAYGLGEVTNDFTAASLARTLDALTPARVSAYSRAADAAARELSAENQMEPWSHAISRLARMAADAPSLATGSAREDGTVDRRPRLTAVSAWFPTQTAPSRGAFVLRDLAAISAHADVRLVHLVPPQDDDGTRRLTLPLDGPDGERRNLEVLRIPMSPRSPLSVLRARRALRSALAEADLVHTMAFPTLLPLATGLPLPRDRRPGWVHTEHWSALTTPETLTPPARAALPLLTRLLRRPDTVTAVCDFLAAPIRAVRDRAPSRPTVVVGCIVEPHQTAPRRDRADGSLRLISVGGLIDRKDPLLAVDTLAELAARGHDARLTLVGDGPLRAQVVARAREHGVSDRLVLAGTLDPDGVRDALARHDLFLGPTRADNFFVSAAEAIVAGRPVVLGANGGQGEYVDPAIGELLTTRDPAAYADAVLRVDAATSSMSSAEIAATIGDAFSGTRIGRAYAAVYAALPQRSASPDAVNHQECP